MAAEDGGYSYVTDVSYELQSLSRQFSGRNALSSNKQPFIPLQQLELFWTVKKIERVAGLCARFKGSIVLSPFLIKTRFLRVYSLLVALEKPEQIELFTKWGLEDEKFPLETFPSDWPGIPANQALYELIHEFQWTYFPVLFEKGFLHNQLLSANAILPIENEEVMRQSTEVVLYKASLEGSSIFAKPENGKIKVVRKQYLGTKRKVVFERERRAFETLQSRPCKHIVECYGSFGQRQPNGDESYSLILEHFGAGNLEEFFQRASPPQNKAQLVKFWRSFRGLFAALDTIHHADVGRDHSLQTHEIVHQDIKPQNILFSLSSLDTNQHPVLKVIDFGYSFTRHSSQTHFLESGGSQAHAPPECSHHGRWKNRRQNSITTAADIWSAGCVISEAAAWVSRGHAGRVLYENDRTTEAELRAAFENAGVGGCFHDGTGRLKTVDSVHQSIKNSLPSYDDITEQILALVDRFMLVPRDQRKEAWDIRENLGKIIDRAASEETSQANTLVTQSTPQQTRNQNSFEPRSSPDVLVTKFDGPDDGTTRQPPPPGARPDLVLDIPSDKHLRPITPPASSPFTQPSGERGLSMEEARKYIKDKKAGRPVEARVQRVIQQLKDNLSSRDHLFFVDTSSTMALHRAEVTDTLRVYAYIAKQIDKNGIDAGFSTNPQPRRYGTTKTLLDALKKQRWTSAAFENSFGTFLDAVIGSLPSWFPLEKAKRQSIFVLTDGRWGRSDIGACGVEVPILR